MGIMKKVVTLLLVMAIMCVSLGGCEALCSHIFNDQVTLPTCTSKGYTTHTCVKCGMTYTDCEVPVAEHSYSVTVVPATCQSEGYTTHRCMKCGYSYTDTKTPQLAHSYETSVVSPTCISDGYTLHKCKYCSDSYKTDTVSSSTGKHSGVDTCSLCKVNFYEVLKNYAKTYGNYESYGVYIVPLNSYNGAYSYLFWDTGSDELMFYADLPDNNYLEVYLTEGAYFDWSYYYGDYYYMRGTTKKSSMINSLTTISYTRTNAPSSLVAALSKVSAAALTLLLTMADIGLEHNCQMSLYNIGFTNY